MIDFERNQGLVSEILEEQRAIELVAVTRLSACEVAGVPLVTTLVEGEGGLRRHEVRIVIVVVAGETQENRTYSRTVGGGGIAELENILVGRVVGP